MRIGSFSVQVPQGVEVGDGYVRMKHNTRYSVKMGNHGSRRVDVDVKIDGKFMGLFRINPGCYFDLDRPSHDKSCFTFFKANSEEGSDAGAATVDREARGLIVVTFKPEKDQPPPVRTKGLTRSIDVGYQGDAVEMSRFVPGGPGGQSVGGNAPECRARGGEYDQGTLGREEKTSGGILRHLGHNKSAPPTGVEAGITGLTGHSNTNFIEVPELDYDPTLELPITLRLVADKAVRPLTEAPRGNPAPAAVD